MCSKELIFPS